MNRSVVLMAAAVACLLRASSAQAVTLTVTGLLGIDGVDATETTPAGDGGNGGDATADIPPNNNTTNMATATGGNGGNGGMSLGIGVGSNGGNGGNATLSSGGVGPAVFGTDGLAGNASSVLIGNNPYGSSNYNLTTYATAGNGGGQFTGHPVAGGNATATSNAISSAATAPLRLSPRPSVAMVAAATLVILETV
jgi:hypothetical protein